jgi:putative membrane protein insertion efficiency factor
MRAVMKAPAAMAAGVIRFYQVVISPMSGPHCRFYPSCSSYALSAVRSYGLFRGGAMAAWRILRCNPWNPGGVDYVPARKPQTRRTGAQEKVSYELV